MGLALWSGRRLHFVGIGGAGMSGLALVARELGASVSGSDRAASSYLTRLERMGIPAHVGHDATNLPEGAEVVVSTAIADDNPELAAARAAGARVLHRADLLGEVTRLKPCVAVSGTHGKTTTASMAAHALLATGREPSYLIGGELSSSGTNAAWGDGEWLVVEADESDRSFLKLHPALAVVTNVELDHHATYRSTVELERAFEEFAALAPEAAVAVDAPLAADGATRFGIDAGDLAAHDVELLPGGSRFTVEGVDVELRVPGRHNVMNALAALAACRSAGAPIAEVAPALASFRGARRRFDKVSGAPPETPIYDDYAHHPTEVRATLEAARTLSPQRLVAAFQPHLYSRTAKLAREFGRALALADVVVVLDVYPSRERAEDHPGVSGWLVAAAAAAAGRGRPVYWTPTIGQAADAIEPLVRTGDMVVTLGAGDVDQLASLLAERLSARARAV